MNTLFLLSKCPLRLIASFLLGRALVALRDQDGEVSIRVADMNVLGESTAERLSFGIRTVTLLPDGKVGNGCYVKSWTMLRDFRSIKKQSMSTK